MSLIILLLDHSLQHIYMSTPFHLTATMTFQQQCSGSDDEKLIPQLTVQHQQQKDVIMLSSSFPIIAETTPAAAAGPHHQVSVQLYEYVKYYY